MALGIKNLSAMQETVVSVPAWGGFLGGEHGNPLQYSCLENPRDRGAWWATNSPWGYKQSDMSERLTLSLSHEDTQ